MKKRQLPVACPSCQQELAVEKLHCHACGTTVQGDFALPVLLHLQPEERAFLLQFTKASGSLKEMARLSGYSYPTVRNQLNDLIDTLEKLEKQHHDENKS